MWRGANFGHGDCRLTLIMLLVNYSFAQKAPEHIDKAWEVAHKGKRTYRDALLPACAPALRDPYLRWRGDVRLDRGETAAQRIVSRWSRGMTETQSRETVCCRRDDVPNLTL
jgi:hypothetical protein